MSGPRWRESPLSALLAGKICCVDTLLAPALAEGHVSKLGVELQAANESPPVMDVARPSIARPRAHVLVIDDEPQICAIVEGILADELVEAFVKPREGLARALEVSFDVIFCDLNMPDMTGLDVFLALEHRMPAAVSRFVLMSGSVGNEAVRTLASCGVPVLAKPFCIAEVESHVARLMASKLQ